MMAAWKGDTLKAAFEQLWLSGDSHLAKVPGFVVFHLLKAREAEDHTLYASHTVWENRKTRPYTDRGRDDCFG